MFDRVVVGVTDSARSDAVMDRAMAIVRASRGTLHLVSAFGPHRPPAPAMPEEFRYSLPMVDPVDYRLGELKAKASRASIAVVVHPVLSGAVDALTKVARDEQADLIVVGAKVAHGPGHLGNVPRALMEAAPCAVLVV